MSSTVQDDADAVFAELDMVASLFWRLQESPLWASEGRRLPVSLHEIIGALAQTAFTRFPADPRRWRAGSMMFGLSGAFADPASNETSTAWNYMVSAAESEILASTEASETAVVAAFRSASSHALKGIENENPEVSDAALRRYDELVARLRAPEPAIVGLPMLIAALERQDMRSELLSRLTALVASEDDRVRAFAAGRLLVLKSRDVPADLAFDDINGVPVDLREMRGEVVLVQFWASWCAPCRAEIPRIRSVKDRYAERGLRIVGVSLDKLAEGESLEEARIRITTFMHENGMDWPSHFDGLWWNNACASRFGVRSLPASLLLDRSGRVAVLNPRGDDIAGQVESLLA